MDILSSDVVRFVQSIIGLQLRLLDFLATVSIEPLPADQVLYTRRHCLRMRARSERKCKAVGAPRHLRHARADTCSFPFPFCFTHVSRVTFITCLLDDMSRHRRSFTYTDVSVTSSRSSSGLDACLSNHKSRVMFCGLSTSCFKVILSDELHYSCNFASK